MKLKTLKNKNERRKKPVSTLTLLTEDEFTDGLKEFEKKIRRKYGEKILVESEYTLLVGER
jgi:hypothetical protein